MGAFPTAVLHHSYRRLQLWLINTEKQHIKLSGSLHFFSALFVLQLQATIAAVEDWIYTRLPGHKVKVKMDQTEAMGWSEEPYKIWKDFSMMSDF